MEEAVELDLHTLTMELARLQDSVNRLEDTQKSLAEFLDASADKDEDLSTAYKENVDVIGSQKERMNMIRLALSHKGVSSESLSHYIPEGNSSTRVAQADASTTEEGGIDL